ncbi:MAG: BLUF domain-containing protein [Steroidobacteraceae bacterium]
MASLIHCIYTSKAVASFEEHSIPALLEISRRNNSRRAITGMLLYTERNFFQVLEGAELDVTSAFDRIARDPRHSRVTTIIREPIFERAFADWTMGFANVELDEVTSHIGENDFFADGECFKLLSPGRARKLLGAFRQGRWRSDETGVYPLRARMK